MLNPLTDRTAAHASAAEEATPFLNRGPVERLLGAGLDPADQD
jgi:hypothetical protein